MSNEPDGLLSTYGMSADRIKRLLECKPAEGHKVKAAKERNRLAQAKWRAANPEKHRARVRESMRRLRAKRKAQWGVGE